MDETGFKCMGQKLFVWFLVDMEEKLLIDVHLTVNSRTAYDVLFIVKQLGLWSIFMMVVRDIGLWIGLGHRRDWS